MIISRIKRMLKNSSILFLPIKVYRRRKKEHDMEIFHKFGYEVNEMVYEVLRNRSECSYCCAFGTLLGIVRENGFIPYDDDLDYFIIIRQEDIANFNKTLNSNGFSFKHLYSRDGIIRELGYDYKGVNVDFFLLFSDDKHDAINFFYRKADRLYSMGEVSTTTCILPMICEYHIIETHSSHFVIPMNADSVLCALYGNNWRIPQRGLKAGQSIGNRVNNDDLISYQYNHYTNNVK